MTTMGARDATYEHYAAALERTVRMLDGSTVTLTGKGGAAAGTGDTSVLLDDIEVRFYGRRDGLIVYEGTGTYRTGPTRYEPDPDDIFARDDSWWRNPWEPEPPPRPRGLAALGYGMASEVRS